MLRLIIDEKERVVQSASVPVRWCVSKEVLDELKRFKTINPFILIVTVVNEQEMTRQLVPMEDMMTYVQFAKPGQNTIFARIVWSSDGKFNSLWEKYLQRSRGRYDTTVVNFEGKMIGEAHGPLKAAEVTVIVPKELFAKEPPEWEQKWVNLFFLDPPKDQCDYRKRRLLAYTFQPIWFVVRFVVGLIIAIILLLCGKWPSFKPLVCLSGDFGDIWNDATNSVFVRKWYSENYHARKLLFLLPLLPIFWLCLFALFCFLSHKEKGFVMWDVAIFGAVFMTIFLAIVGGIADGIRFLSYFLGKKIKQTSKKKPEAEMEYDIFEPLLCDGYDIKPRIADLPLERRTVHLRFLDLKAKVCKPFAR